MSDFRVWFDRKRQCYVSNVALVYAKRLGIPAPVLAAYLAELVKARLPELVEDAWVS